MTVFFEVAVNVPQVSGVFDYHAPPELENILRPGHLVEAPFGRQTVQGVILQIISQPSVPETRSIFSLVDPEIALTENQIQLARQISVDTLSPLATCINLAIPPGLAQHVDTLYELTKPGAEVQARASLSQTGGLSKTQTRLVHLLQERGPLRGRQIAQSLSRINWRSAANALVRRGLLTTHSYLPPPSARPKLVRTAHLACSPKEAEKLLAELSHPGTQSFTRRQAILRALIRENAPVNVSWLYAESSGSSADLRWLVDKGLVRLGQDETWRDPLSDADAIPTQPAILTADQQAVWQMIQSGLTSVIQGNPVLPYLLHGVTGSGKTEIYLQAVAEAIQLGYRAIVLVPEIALTPQTVNRFLSRFPGRVGLVHSGLSQGERYDTWRRARNGDLDLVVGPRSALFTPFEKLGLIIVDECHDDSYYQADPQPRYHARQAAIQYARLAGALCLLGSATPDITSRFAAEQGKYHYLSLPARILAHRTAVQRQMEKLSQDSSRLRATHFHPLDGDAESADLPPVRVVDMRQELKAGNRSIFSRALRTSLENVLASGEQAILFLNRRGSATFVFCRDCGYAMRCPNCDIPLTFHSQLPTSDKPSEGLLCHHCGYRRLLPKICPNCRSSRIRQYGTGTEKVEEEVRACFPQARTLRWDYETTRQKGAHQLILSQFRQQQADILIGTQMIAKGLDLPLITLVGVVLADANLNLPDFRMAERTFQTLTQVAGRAGRSPLGGEVILQTFQPDHYVIQAAAHHDYEAFYRRELAFRKSLAYPPFSRFVRLEYRHNDPAAAEKTVRDMAARIQVWIEQEERSATSLIGPAPCFFARVGGQYRWQIILRSPNPLPLLSGRNFGDWRIEVDPPSLL
jgi:primosomal protein N' (replication factor Y)